MTSMAPRFVLCIATCIACLSVAACFTTGTLDSAPAGPGLALTPAGETPAPQTALNTIVPGKSTKAQVATALGTAIVIPFDSGYEVWVYRWRGADATTRAATELVVLFDPSGLAAKARVRPGYETPK
ncbi:MAG: hypothetical protein V4792_18465 [Pseudomonadota bacterium]